MNLVIDTSSWIEILNSTKKGKTCNKKLSSAKKIFVPAVVIYELYKVIAKKIGEDEALKAISFVSLNEIVSITREISLDAADISLKEKLAMADSLVLAVSKQKKATLLTCDNDFQGIDGVEVVNG